MKLFTATLAVAVHATALVAQVPDTARVPLHALTRAEAISAALASNPQLDVAREQTAQAKARRVSAVAIPDPQLTYSLDGQPQFLSLGSAAQRNAALGIDIPFPDKFRLRNKVATADVRSFEYSYAGLRQQLAAQAGREYDSLLVTVRHRSDFALGRDLARDFLAKTKARFDAGTVAKLDVIRAQVALAQAENDYISSDRNVVIATDALDRVIGQPLGTPIVPADSLTVPRDLPDVELLQQSALASRPELAGIASQQAGASAATSLAKEFWFPDFTLSAQRDYGSSGGPALFSAGIAMPIPLLYWQHSRGDIAESQHRERELTAAARDLRAQVAQDVRASYAAASTALRQAIYIRDQLLPSAREAYRVASVSYGLGGSSALDVLDARRSLLDAQSQYADALAAASSARADLERATAAPLDRFPTRREP